MPKSIAFKAVVFLFFVTVSFFPQLGNATFFGEVKTGLQNIATDRYGYSIYIPDDYTSDRSWPLVLALHHTGDRGEDYIQKWVQAAKERGMIVLCPTYDEPRSGVPYDHDERLIRLKNEIQSLYEVDENKILVAGFGTGGHYALYLGLRYPKDFTAIASIGNALEGTLEKLFVYSYAEINKPPILMLVQKQEDINNSKQSLSRLQEIKERGYPVETVEAENSQDLENINTNSYVLEWFAQVSSERADGLKQRDFSLKQSFYEWVDNLVQSR